MVIAHRLSTIHNADQIICRRPRPHRRTGHPRRFHGPERYLRQTHRNFAVVRLNPAAPRAVKIRNPGLLPHGKRPDCRSRPRVIGFVAKCKVSQSFTIFAGCQHVAKIFSYRYEVQGSIKGLDLAGTAADVLGEWDARDTFHKSIETREGHPTFVFYEGPPRQTVCPASITSWPEPSRTSSAATKPSRDTSCTARPDGIPTVCPSNWASRRNSNHQGGYRQEDLHRGVQPHLPRSRHGVHRRVGEPHPQDGILGQYGRPYITYDNKYIESLWWLLAGSTTRGCSTRAIPFSPTRPRPEPDSRPTSLNQPGCYRDVKDTTVVAQFRIRNPKPEMEGWGTPTSWPGPRRPDPASNTALCVGPKIDYVAVRSCQPLHR